MANTEDEESIGKQKQQSTSEGENESGAASLDDFVSPDLQDQLFEKAQVHGAAMAAVTDIHAKRRAIEDGREQFRLDIPDIVERARAIHRNYPPDWREYRTLNSAGTQITAPLNTDVNVMDAFECLFGNGTGRPHFDTFKGFCVDWEGNTIDDDFNIKPLLDALVSFRIPSPSAEKVEKLFKRFARQVKINSLTERMKIMIPAWDGLPRMDDYLIRLFETFDTALNRQFGKYFWLSLHNRAMYPGCNAPMVLALFGHQGIGKSYLGTLISREMTGMTDSDSVPLDWSTDFNVFLRKITGVSVIANVAEMAGFTKAELTKIKALTTRTMDVMDYKFERDTKQMRQWIMIMDGNEYAGLQRDETGNRRFYPMFVGQLPFDSAGQVQWRDDFYANFDTFSVDFWQLMAEAQTWMRKEGMTGYQKLVMATERAVKNFSDEEMRNDRGTIRDDDLDMYMMAAAAIVEPMFMAELRSHRQDDGTGKVGRVSNKKGCVVFKGDMRNAILAAAGRNVRVIPTHLKSKMTAIGAKTDKYANQNVFTFESINNRSEWDGYMTTMFGPGYGHFRKRRLKDSDDSF